MYGTTLPEHYREILKIDLQTDKKRALFVNILALLLAVGMVALPVAFRRPVALTVDISLRTLYKLLALLAAILAYLLAHEAVHGVFMRLFGGGRPHFGFTGLYAYAGSRAYFRKWPYTAIALAPVVLLGLLLLFLQCVLPADAFLPLYVLQIVNVSGAAGDFYVTALVHTLPPDVLVQDTGVCMTFFSAQPNPRRE